MLSWILGGGLVSYGVLALVAPHLIPIVASILKGIIDGLIAYLRTIWDGAMDMLDNSSSLVFVATVAGIAYLYGYLDKTPTIIEKPSVSSKYNPSKKQEKQIFTHPLDWWSR
jgi:hypothetical protein